MAEASASLSSLANPRRRGLSLTPLVDVIFLLLLFFMLASSFSRQVELDLAATAAGAPGPEAPPLFLRLEPSGLSLNGVALDLDALPAALADPRAAPPVEDGALPLVMVSLRDGVTAQRLVDLLAVLRAAGHPALVLE